MLPIMRLSHLEPSRDRQGHVDEIGISLTKIAKTVMNGFYFPQDEYAEELLGDDHYATQFFNALNSDEVLTPPPTFWSMRACLHARSTS